MACKEAEQTWDVFIERHHDGVKSSNHFLMSASCNRLDGNSCTFVHVVAVSLTGIHHSRRLAVPVKSILGNFSMDTAGDDDCRFDLRIFQETTAM